MRKSYPIFDTPKKAQEFAEKYWGDELARGEEVAIFYCGNNYIVGIVGEMDILPSGYKWRTFIL